MKTNEEENQKLKPRVSRVTIARMFNLGNYEHEKFEVTVDIPEGCESEPGQVISDLEAALNDLSPKCPVEDWRLDNAKAALSKPFMELSDHELRCLNDYKAALKEREEWLEKQTTAKANLANLGHVESEYKDAKEDWNDDGQF